MRSHALLEYHQRIAQVQQLAILRLGIWLSFISAAVLVFWYEILLNLTPLGAWFAQRALNQVRDISGVLAASALHSTKITQQQSYNILFKFSQSLKFEYICGREGAGGVAQIFSLVKDRLSSSEWQSTIGQSILQANHYCLQKEAAFWPQAFLSTMRIKDFMAITRGAAMLPDRKNLHHYIRDCYSWFFKNSEHYPKTWFTELELTTEKVSFEKLGRAVVYCDSLLHNEKAVEMALTDQKQISWLVATFNRLFFHRYLEWQFFLIFCFVAIFIILLLRFYQKNIAQWFYGYGILAKPELVEDQRLIQENKLLYKKYQKLAHKVYLTKIVGWFGALLMLWLLYERSQMANSLLPYLWLALAGSLLPSGFYDLVFAGLIYYQERTCKYYQSLLRHYFLKWAELEYIELSGEARITTLIRFYLGSRQAAKAMQLALQQHNYSIVSRKEREIVAHFPRFSFKALKECYEKNLLALQGIAQLKQLALQLKIKRNILFEILEKGIDLQGLPFIKIRLYSVQFREKAALRRCLAASLKGNQLMIGVEGLTIVGCAMPQPNQLLEKVVFERVPDQIAVPNFPAMSFVRSAHHRRIKAVAEEKVLDAAAKKPVERAFAYQESWPRYGAYNSLESSSGLIRMVEGRSVLPGTLFIMFAAEFTRNRLKKHAPEFDLFFRLLYGGAQRLSLGVHIKKLTRFPEVYDFERRCSFQPEWELRLGKGGSRMFGRSVRNANGNTLIIVCGYVPKHI